MGFVYRSVFIHSFVGARLAVFDHCHDHDYEALKEAFFEFLSFGFGLVRRRFVFFFSREKKEIGISDDFRFLFFLSFGALLVSTFEFCIL